MDGRGTKTVRNLISYLSDRTECNLRCADDTGLRAVFGMLEDQGVLKSSLQGLDRQADQSLVMFNKSKCKVQYMGNTVG